MPVRGNDTGPGGALDQIRRLFRHHQHAGVDVGRLSAHSQAYLNKVARQLNERPRETLQFETQQRDLTPVLRRPVEPARQKRK